MALTSTSVTAAEAASRSAVLQRLRLTDAVFRGLTRGRGARCAGAAGGVIVVAGHRRGAGAPRRSASPSSSTERGIRCTEQFGALAPIYGTLVTSLIAMLIAVPVSFGIALFLTELCPSWLRRPLGTAIELLAGIPSIIYGMWGLFVFAPVPAAVRAAVADRRRSAACRCSARCSPARRYGIGMLTAGLILAIMVMPFIASVMRDVFEPCRRC